MHLGNQEAATKICMSTTPPVVIAFGQKDDAIDRLPGVWRDQWRVKVVQATVQAMEMTMKKEAMIIFIDSEGRSEATPMAELFALMAERWAAART